MEERVTVEVDDNDRDHEDDEEDWRKQNLCVFGRSRDPKRILDPNSVEKDDLLDMDRYERRLRSRRDLAMAECDGGTTIMTRDDDVVTVILHCDYDYDYYYYTVITLYNCIDFIIEA